MKEVMKKNKRGVSAVIGTVIMVALVIGLTAIIWTVVTGVVEDELDGARSCLGNFDKVTIIDRYTCNNHTLEGLFYFSISSKINLSEIVVSVSGNRSVKSFRINNFEHYPDVRNFIDADFIDAPLILPGENEGKSYVIDTIAFGISVVDAIEIAPVVGGEQCDISDTLLQIDDCRVFI